MMKLKKLAKILLFIQYTILGLMAGLLFTLFTGSAQDQGLAAGAVLVFNAVIGVVVGMVAAVISIMKVRTTSIPKINMLLVALNIVAVIVLVIIVRMGVG